MPDEIRQQANTAGSHAIHLGWATILFVLLLQFWSRYLPSPLAVFVADDWANWARSSFYPSHVQAALTGLQDPNRPLSMMAVGVMYRLLGDHAIYWTVISLIANSLLLLLVMKIAVELTGRRLITALTGVIFALLPNLTETYHWSTQVLNEVACALVPYALSAWLWVAYLRRGGAWRLALSALSFGVALFSYEAGMFLPAAYLVLLPWRKAPAKSILSVIPIGAVGLFYLTWRTTNSFGLNYSWHYPPHMEGHLSLTGIIFNAWQLFHWWAGDNLFGAIRNGFDSFATIPLWTRRFLFVANAVVVTLIGWRLRKLATATEQTGEAKPFTALQVYGFALIWAGMAMAMSLVSYTAGRLNVLPAIGISLLLALIFNALSIRKLTPVLILPAFLAIVANQGTAESFRQSGELQQHLFTEIKATQPDWQDKEILLIDTRALRQRLTPGLLKPVGTADTTWATYGNALLIRGFVLNGMVKLTTGQKDTDITVLHDVEYGARIEGNHLLWHDRYNPSRPRTNSLDEVFIVDTLAVSQTNHAEK